MSIVFSGFFEKIAPWLVVVLVGAVINRMDAVGVPGVWRIAAEPLADSGQILGG